MRTRTIIYENWLNTSYYIMIKELGLVSNNRVEKNEKSAKELKQELVEVGFGFWKRMNGMGYPSIHHRAVWLFLLITPKPLLNYHHSSQPAKP